MPVPIHGGLVEFVTGVRIRKRGNDCPARRVLLVYFVTAAEDDVVCRWVEGETMRRNTGQQLVQCRLGSAKGDYPECSRGAAVGRGTIMLLSGLRIRPLTSVPVTPAPPTTVMLVPVVAFCSPPPTKMVCEKFAPHSPLQSVYRVAVGEFDDNAK